MIFWEISVDNDNDKDDFGFSLSKGKNPANISKIKVPNAKISSSLVIWMEVFSSENINLILLLISRQLIAIPETRFSEPRYSELLD